MILIRNIKLPIDAGESALLSAAAEKLRVSPERIIKLRPVKRSLDARKKENIRWVYSVAAELTGSEEKIIAHAKSADVSEYKSEEYTVPFLGRGASRPVVVGFGPAGMFAALVLSHAGLCPIVLERGQDALTRMKKVEAFRNRGTLDSECNVQFGEGGAGTFSDGKLNTGTHDRRMSWVLGQFAAHGAPESVTWDAKPHVGTDVLIDVVQRIRADVLAHGGELRFGARLDGLVIENGCLRGAEVTEGERRYTLPCGSLILAIGHSARDTFEMLCGLDVPMERKPFSMGVRIEHKQADIDLAQYGRERGELPPADYALNVHLPDGTSAYTFCMCPGGQVFAAASEQGGVVTNGMSYSRRDGENANAALLVTLHTDDFPGEGVLAGMEWQREIERAAYAYGGGDYRAPAQLAGDFLAHRASTGPGSVQPSYRPGVVWGDVRDVLPQRITDVLQNAIPALGKKLAGFDAADAVLTAPETRSSSPVRILRGEDLSSAVEGLYPCGEGAGYAGGITSAAVDGVRCAEAVMERQRKEKP